MNLTTHDKLRIIVAGVVGDISDAQWSEIEQGLVDQKLHVHEIGPISFANAANDAYRIMGLERAEWDPRAISKLGTNIDPMDRATLGLLGEEINSALYGRNKKQFKKDMATLADFLESQGL